MRWLEVNGTTLRYECSGTGPFTIVFIHEAGGSLESWDDVLAALGGRYRTLRYDQRGFGMSERASSLSLEGMVADLCGLLDALGINGKRCCLVGTAIGGTIALACAAWHPGRVAAVIATSPVTGPISAAAAAALEQRARSLETAGMRSIADASLARSYPERLRQDADRFAQFKGRFLANDPASFAALTRTFHGIDLAPLIETIRQPVLVVGCTHDSIKPPAECRQLADSLPNGRFCELDSGHYVSVISPQLIGRQIADFLESIDAPNLQRFSAGDESEPVP